MVKTTLWHMESNVAPTLNSLRGPILVTGHTGFKGTWLTRFLLQLNVDVVGYSLPPKEQDLFSRAQLRGAIHEEFSDIRDFERFEAFVKKTKPVAILHLAAQSLVMESYRDPIGTFEVNVMGTANVLEVARKAQSVKAVIVVTTDKVYQNLNTGKRFKEDDSLLGNDPYSASKVGSENVALAWRQLAGSGQDLKISVVRSGNVVGGGDLSKDRLLADVVRARISNSIIQIRNLNSTRPWQHVLDPLHGYLFALARAITDVHGDSFNFGPTDPSLQVKEVLDIALEFWPDLTIKIEESSSAGYESHLLDLDSTYARKTLGWAPKFSQREAILETLRWWQEVLFEEKDCLTVLDRDINEFLKV